MIENELFLFNNKACEAASLAEPLIASRIQARAAHEVRFWVFVEGVTGAPTNWSVVPLLQVYLPMTDGQYYNRSPGGVWKTVTADAYPHMFTSRDFPVLTAAEAMASISVVPRMLCRLALNINLTGGTAPKVNVSAGANVWED